jgi:hypothetical protein
MFKQAIIEGKTSRAEDFYLNMRQPGTAESFSPFQETYYTFTLSPIFDETGRAGGVYELVPFYG